MNACINLRYGLLGSLGRNGSSASDCIHRAECREHLLTKGAVSQTVSFLEEKRLTVREPSPKGGRNQGLYLSETGQRVLAEHHALHGDMIAEISRLAGRLPPEAIEFLSQVTDVIEENIRSIQQQQ